MKVAMCGVRWCVAKRVETSEESLLHDRDGRRIEQAAIASLTDARREALCQLKRRIDRYLTIGAAIDRDVAEPGARARVKPSEPCTGLTPHAIGGVACEVGCIVALAFREEHRAGPRCEQTRHEW